MVRERSVGIFVASPGDMGAARAQIKRSFEKFNQTQEPDHPTLEFVGWEDAPPAVGRPQGLINRQIKACSYMLVLFCDRWGSRSSVDGPYTSGTEEEFFMGLAALEDPRHLLLDVSLIFQQPQPGGPDVEVEQFKRNVTDSKGILYKEVKSPEELQNVLEALMSTWVVPRDKKTRTIRNITTVSGLDVLSCARHKRNGAALEDAGVVDAALAEYKKSSELGDDHDLLDYARALLRHDRLGLALEVAEGILGDVNSSAREPLTAEVGRARMLKGVVLTRKGGGPVAARRELELSARIFEGIEGCDEFHAEALDHLGGYHRSVKNFSGALEFYEKAQSIRKSVSSSNLAHSEINIARTLYYKREYDRALMAISEARQRPDFMSTDEVAANILHLESQVSLALCKYDQALRCAEESLQLNEYLGSERGKAMALMQVAKAAVETGQREKAKECLERSLKINTRLGDERGEKFVMRYSRKVGIDFDV